MSTRLKVGDHVQLTKPVRTSYVDMAPAGTDATIARIGGDRIAVNLDDLAGDHLTVRPTDVRPVSE